MIIHDRNVKFTKTFTKMLKDAGVKTNPLPKGSPNLNGRCERLIEIIKLGYLRESIVLGKRHLDRLITEFMTHYNTRRSHMKGDHLPPIRDVPEEVVTLRLDPIEMNSYVGELVNRCNGRRSDAVPLQGLLAIVSDLWPKSQVDHSRHTSFFVID